jgi:hypothetical protein
VRFLTACIYTQNSERIQKLRDRDITVKMYVFFKVQLFSFYEKGMNRNDSPEELEISKSEVLGFGIQFCTLPRSYTMRRNDLYWFLCIHFINSVECSCTNKWYFIERFDSMQDS